MDDEEDILDDLLEEEDVEEEDEIDKNADIKNENIKKQTESKKSHEESLESFPLLKEILQYNENEQKNENIENIENNISKSNASNNLNISKDNNTKDLNLNNLYPNVPKTEKNISTNQENKIQDNKSQENDNQESIIEENIIQENDNQENKFQENNNLENKIQTNKNIENKIKENKIQENNDDNNKIEIPFQSLEERLFLTQQKNINPNQKDIEQNDNKINNEIKEEESSETDRKDDKKIKFIKFKKIKETQLEKKINAILKRSSKISNNFDKVEEAYNVLKKPLEVFLSKPETNDEVEIIRQNSQILVFFDLLNKILSLVSDNPIPVFKKKKPVKENKNKNKDINEIMKEEREKIEANNNKIISNYESEIDRMKKILEKIRDENYENNLDENIKTKKEQIFLTEKKIMELKIKIKQREIEQNREIKKNTKEAKLKNLICDYKIKRKERAILAEKITTVKNTFASLQNFKAKCQQKLTDKKKNAYDLYGITDIKTMKEINFLKKKYRKEEMNLVKIKDLEKISEHKKKAYEKLIAGCKREINILKERKKELEEDIKKEEVIQTNVQKRIQGFFGNKNIFVSKDNIDNKNNDNTNKDNNKEDNQNIIKTEEKAHDEKKEEEKKEEEKKEEEKKEFINNIKDINDDIINNENIDNKKENEIKKEETKKIEDNINDKKEKESENNKSNSNINIINNYNNSDIGSNKSNNSKRKPFDFKLNNLAKPQQELNQNNINNNNNNNLIDDKSKNIEKKDIQEQADLESNQDIEEKINDSIKEEKKPENKKKKKIPEFLKDENGNEEYEYEEFEGEEEKKDNKGNNNDNEKIDLFNNENNEIIESEEKKENNEIINNKEGKDFNNLLNNENEENKKQENKKNENEDVEELSESLII